MQSPRDRRGVGVLVALSVLAVGVLGQRARQDHEGVRTAARDALVAAVQSDLADQARALAEAEPPASGDAPSGTTQVSSQPHPPPVASRADTSVAPLSGGTETSTTSPTSSDPAPPEAAAPPPSNSGTPGGDDGAPGGPSGDEEELDETDVVLLTPILASAEFGATTGFLLACNTAVGAVSSGAAEFGPEFAEALSPVVREITTGCRDLSSAAKEFLVQLNDGLEALEAANPYSEPFFEASAQVFTALAELKDELGPLGPVAAALGPIVQHFGPPPSDD